MADPDSAPASDMSQSFRMEDNRETESHGKALASMNPAQLRQRLNRTLESLKLKMVPKEYVKVDSKAPMVRGSFGEVSRGQLEGHSESVAIKQIRSRGDAEARLRVEVAFARELLVWERLSHFNLLPLLAFRFDSTDGLLQFISPYAEPGNVSRYLKNTNPDMTTRLQLSLDTAEGLSYLHERKTCHGDLKGENVLIFIVDGRPTATLCDFGLSKIEEDVPSGLTTATFNTKGTLIYQSPELVSSEEPKRDLMSDMWAWGCVVLEVTSDRLPYAELHNILLIAGKIGRGIHPATEAQMAPHEGVRSILKQCWEKEPEDRPTIATCRSKLIDFVAQASEGDIIMASG